MSYGTTFTCDIFINHMTFDTIDDVKEEIANVDARLSEIRERFMLYVGLGEKSQQRVDEEGSLVDLVYSLHQDLSSLLCLYEGLVLRRQELSYLLDKEVFDGREVG